MSDIPRAFGRLHIPDKRDDLYPFSAAEEVLSTPLEEKRASVSLRSAKRKCEVCWGVKGVLDQGRMPHCVAFAWKHYLIGAPIKQARFLVPAFLYELAQKYDQWPGENYDGTSVRGAVKILNKLGFVKSYWWGKSAKDVHGWVMKRGPVVLGTLWYENMSRLDRSGYAIPSGRVLGGHAYLCIGYNKKRKAFKCLNSWGASWGVKGKFWISFKNMDFLVKKGGEACIALERNV